MTRCFIGIVKEIGLVLFLGQYWSVLYFMVIMLYTEVCHFHRWIADFNLDVFVSDTANTGVTTIRTSVLEDFIYLYLLQLLLFK